MKKTIITIFSLFFVFSFSIAQINSVENIKINEIKNSSVPKATQTSAQSDRARELWLSAAQKYSEKSFTPQKVTRLDSRANYMVMLQGFHWYADSYWYNPPNGWWGVLAEKAKDIYDSGFEMIWFPPVSIGSYYPTEWYNLNSQWGKEEYLRKAIKEMHKYGIYVIADVVLNHRNGKTDWYDFKNPDWPSTVIVQDDEWRGFSDQPYNGKSPNYDEGQGDWGCRDLDHRSQLVQEDTKIFMRWLKNDLGFDGWRYDMVKGYSPYYVKLYNYASSPVFTVGEFYDTNRQLIVNWIDGTDDTSDKKNASSAFDFTTKYNLINAVESERYEVLSDNGKPSGLIGWWPEKSVTFVENHDTSPRDPNFISNASKEYKIQRMMGYAYILTHPGVPSVFWPHFYDWGQDYKNAIKKLIQIRKKAGINSKSPIKILAAQNELYAALITGDKYYVVLKLGKNWGWYPGNEWTLETSGERYAVWTLPIK
ncbi:MAG: alpha-amylase family glycosyl hydrolase [Elusimicrobiales bacterium]|nr:alpha-amylase family glycosyl hydrolase [Elusimicrobiales bacterium]